MKFIKEINLDVREVLYYQYLPVKMNHLPDIRLPPNLEFLREVLNLVDNTQNKYVYVTFKHMYLSGDKKFNRNGWHVDGIFTEDKNFIWCNADPTELYCDDSLIIPSECSESLKYFESECTNTTKIKTLPTNHLIELERNDIHRVSTKPFEGFRAFLKISVSDDKYNLKLNSHNYMFDYDWDMRDREVERNHPSEIKKGIT